MADKTYYLAIPTILVDYGERKRRFAMGDALDDVPPDTLACMIRLRQAVDTLPPPPPEPVRPAPPAAEETTEVSTLADPAGDLIDRPGDPPPPPAWQLTPVASLEIDDEAKESLAEAQLVTVRDVLNYGAAHEGSLLALKGIGKGREKQIQDAIAALIPQS